MTGDPRFSEDEKFLLFNTPAMIGAAMSFAESSGAIGTFKEALANAKTISGGVRDFPGNEVIQSVLPDLEHRESAMATAKAFRLKAVERMKALEPRRLAHAVGLLALIAQNTCYERAS